MSSLLNKCFCMEMPNSHSFDEFSECSQIVLFTLRDPELNAVDSGNADVSHMPSVSWRQVLGRSSWPDGFRKEVPPQRHFGSRFHSWFQANFSIWVTVVMSYSFTNQTLVQLDLLRYWFYGTARCESGVVAPSCSLVLKRT